MEKISESIFSTLPIPGDASVKYTDKILIIKQWNWDYLDCERFQEAAAQIISKNRDHKIFIFCNHPNCFTLGRGNERGEENLVDFDESLASRLNFPVYKIKRGGGITFHHPGQWIFYPILPINEKYNLETHMSWLLKSVKDTLKLSFGLEKAMSAKKLMGVWLERQKLASIGVGVHKFVTIHGVALNLYRDESMFDELKKINPCGMMPTTYIAVENFIEKKENLIEGFHEAYIKSDYLF